MDWSLERNGVAPLKKRFGWCKRLLRDLCSLGPKDPILLYHGPIRTCCGLFAYCAQVKTPDGQIARSAGQRLAEGHSVRENTPRHTLTTHTPLVKGVPLINGVGLNIVAWLKGAKGCFQHIFLTGLRGLGNKGPKSKKHPLAKTPFRQARKNIVRQVVFAQPTHLS